MQNHLRVRLVAQVLGERNDFDSLSGLSLSPIHPVFQNKLISLYATFDEVKEKKKSETFEDLHKPLRHTKKERKRKNKSSLLKSHFIKSHLQV